MKKIFYPFASFFGAIAFLLITSSQFSFSQGTWIQKANFGGNPRSGATSFTIGNKAYIGTGYNDVILLKDFWQYDPQTDTWTQKAAFPGNARFVSAGFYFTVGDKGYFGTGWNGSGAYDESDFWEYNATSNEWTQKAGFAGGQRNGAVGFTIGNKGYIGTGWNITDYPIYFHQDFWEYDPQTDVWTRKNDFPGPGRQGGIGFSIGSKGYIGLGAGGQYSNLTDFFNDFWEYEPTTDTWTQKSNLPADGRQWAVGFGIGTKGYMGTGGTYPNGPHYADWWEWDQANDTWNRKADFAGGARNLATGFSIGTKGYVGTGHDGSPKNDFWEFDPNVVSCNIIVNAGADKIVCTNSPELILNGSSSTGGGTWTTSGSGSFSPDANSLNATYSPSSADISNQSIILTLTTTGNGSCNAASDSLVISIVPNPIVSITPNGPTTFCEGFNVLLTATEGFSNYQWSNGKVSPSIIVSQSGSYFVTVTDTNGCTSVSLPVAVVVNPKPTVNIATNGSTTFCQGGSVFLTAFPSGSYSWTSGETTQSITATQSGKYNVTVTDVFGCSNIQDKKVCSTGNIVSSSVQWFLTKCSPNSTQPYIGLRPVIQPTASFGLIFNSTFNSLPGTACFSCAMTEKQIQDTLESQLKPNFKGKFTFTAKWGTNDILALSINSSDPDVSAISPLSAFFIAFDNYGGGWSMPPKSFQCSIISDPVALTSNPLPVANAGRDTTIFSGQSVQMGSTPVAGLTYSWSPTNGLDNPNIANPIANSTITTTYTLNITNTNGCSASDQINIIVISNPGSSCEAAIDMGRRDTCLSNITVTDSVIWYRFIANAERIKITCTGDSASGDFINSIKVYEGNCAGFQSVRSMGICSSDEDTLELEKDGMITGDGYLLRIAGNPGGHFNLCIDNLPPYSLQNISLDDFYKYSAFAGTTVSADEQTWLDGAVAAMGTIDTTIKAWQVSSGPECATTRAYSQINVIRNALNSFPGSSISSAIGGGQTLENGIYEISSGARMNDTLFLTGDSSSRLLIKINGDLAVNENTRMILNRVQPKNIIWNVKGNVNLPVGVQFSGIIIADGNISYNTVNQGWVSLHSSQGIVIRKACSTSASDKFPIGIFGGRYLHGISATNVLPQSYYASCQGGLPYFAIKETILGNGEYSSQMNVLAEDGFNIITQYKVGPGFITENELSSYLELVKNNKMQVVLGNSGYYKPITYGTGNQNIYDGSCDNNLPNGLCHTRPNFQSIIPNVYAGSITNSCVIFGHHLAEESAYLHFGNPTCDLWWFNENCAFQNFAVPTQNVKDALLYFKNQLQSYGIGHQKRIIMEAYHSASIQQNNIATNYDPSFPAPYNSCRGTTAVFSPQYYLWLDPTATFFEGSYFSFYENDGSVKPQFSDWLFDQNYSNIYNNKSHYLGKFKSIDYAKSQMAEVHSVIGDGVGTLHSNKNIPNANHLWFQAYTSIIHGAKGVWLWDINWYDPTNAADMYRRTLIENEQTPGRFNRNRFPAAYELFQAPLARELRYLVEKGFLSNDPKTIVCSKTDQLDPNCIVPHPVPSPGSYIYDAFVNEFGPASTWNNWFLNIVQEKCTENYGLRYTIRTNGSEAIMIISNPLNIPVQVTLNLNGVANPLVRNATSLDFLFNNNYAPWLSAVKSGSYKINRHSNVNWATGYGGSHTLISVPQNKMVTLAFGPMDVHVIKFITPSPPTPTNPDNKWMREWTNNGTGNVDGWKIQDDDHFISGDFNGDGKEELLTVQEPNMPFLTISKAALTEYNGTDFSSLWNSADGTIGGTQGWQIFLKDKYYAGDFDPGNPGDELLCIQSVNMAPRAMLLKFSGGNWVSIWSNTPGSIGSWSLNAPDKFAVGNFDPSTFTDELVCIEPKNNSARAQVLKFQNGAWASVWSTNNGHFSSTWGIKMQDEFYAGDFDGSGKSDLFILRPGNSVAIISFSNGLWDYMMYPVSNFGGGAVPASGDVILTGNIDNDPKDEIMAVRRISSIFYFGSVLAVTLEKTPSEPGTLISHWSTSYPLQYINDWEIQRETAGVQRGYFFIRPQLPSVDPRDYIFAFRAYCSGYLAGMYKTDGISNFRINEINEAAAKPGDYSESENISVSPNPSDGTFMVNYFSPDGTKHVSSVRVYNMFGQRLLQKDMLMNPNEKTMFEYISISANDLPNGIYFVQCLLSDGSETTTRIDIIK